MILTAARARMIHRRLLSKRTSEQFRRTWKNFWKKNNSTVEEEFRRNCALSRRQKKTTQKRFEEAKFARLKAAFWREQLQKIISRLHFDAELRRGYSTVTHLNCKTKSLRNSKD